MSDLLKLNNIAQRNNMEALKKAREALKWIMRDTGEDDIRARATEALAAIDALGGKEDE